MRFAKGGQRAGAPTVDGLFASFSRPQEEPCAPKTARPIAVYSEFHAASRSQSVRSVVMRIAPARLLSFVAGGVVAISVGGSLLAAELDLSRLDNGLTLILHREPAAPRISLNICYRVGSSDEPDGKSGMAHLLEHLMFEGSAHVPPGAFDAWLREAGGQANAATGEDATLYWMDLPPGALELALFLESDRMGFFSGTITEPRLEEQKRVIAAERRQIEETSPTIAEEWIARPALFPREHPYHEPVIGRPEELDALSLEDLLRFHAGHYRPANASLVIAGPIDVEATRALVRNWFSEIPAGEASPSPVAPPPAAWEQRGIVREPGSSGARLSLHWPSASATSPDHAALVVLADLLGDGPGSWLYESLVREQGLAASVRARQESLRLGGVFTIEIEPIPDRPQGPVLEALDRALAVFIEEGPSGKEVRRSREGLATRFLGEIERLGGFRGWAYRINESWARGGEPGAFADEAVRYRSVRPADLRGAAARWLGSGRVVLSTVPAGRPDLAAGPGGPQ